jgi:hypothetical protein
MAQPWQDTPQSPPASHLLDLPSGSSDDVALLARLIYLLQQVLTPVSPTEPFRAKLRHDLLVAAHERQALAAKQPRRQLTNPWAWLAAGIASTVSVVVGIVTYVIWHRIRTVAS